MEDARNLLAYELIECTLSTAYIVSSVFGVFENFLTKVSRIAPTDKAQEFVVTRLEAVSSNVEEVIVSSVFGVFENFLTKVSRMAPTDKAQEFVVTRLEAVSSNVEEVMQYLFAPFPAFPQHMYTSCG